LVTHDDAKVIIIKNDSSQDMGVLVRFDMPIPVLWDITDCGIRMKVLSISREHCSLPPDGKGQGMAIASDLKKSAA
jgi:hypothetical protein